MVDDHAVNHSDAIRPFPNQTVDEYSVQIKYDENEEKRYLGPVATHLKDDIKLEHPAPSTEVLVNNTHLVAQLHQHNQYRWNGYLGFANDGTTLYDLAVLSVMDETLSVEGLSPESLDIPTRRFNFIFLRKARKSLNLTEFYSYVRDSEVLLSELGYSDEDELESCETLRLELQERLPAELDENEQAALEDAITRTVYAVYRNGIVVPQAYSKGYGFTDLSPPLHERAVRRETEKIALENWVKLFFDETLQPLTFHRTEPRIKFPQYIGLFAASALYDCGLQEVPNVSDYHYSREVIPEGSGVQKYIKREEFQLSPMETALGSAGKTTLIEQFDAVHRATLELARERGFFNKPLPLGVDLWRIEWSGKNNAPTINRPRKSENDISSEWTFAVLAIVDRGARFTLGTRWLQDKSLYPTKLSELQPIVDEFLEVDTIYADAEIISGSLINKFRDIAGPNWVVKAPKSEIVKNLISWTPKNTVGYLPNISWGTTPSPSAVAYPYESDDPSLVAFDQKELKRDADLTINEQRSLSNFNDTEDSIQSLVENKLPEGQSCQGVGSQSTHTVYLTDRSISPNSAASIHYQYYRRWSVEETINQLSNDFLPVTQSASEKVRAYTVNVAVLLENWHTLINRAPSPQLGLRLSVTHQELLRAIENVAFNQS